VAVRLHFSPTIGRLSERTGIRTEGSPTRRGVAMAVITVDEFFAVLEKSRLLTSAQLAQAHDAAGNVDDPTAIARTLARQELITRWQAGQLLAGRSSFYLGKYRLLELLGRGGMGNVFLGQHVTMNRRVALKIISRQIGKDHASLDRFLAEARAVASLDHPNIVQAYNVDNEGDRYYLVMEYVEGLDLQRLVELEGPLDCERAADYVRQAADGLEHAHQRNMIHCDIKPSNLLVNPQGVVKILDMGLARLTDRDESSVDDQDERVLGSVDYLAPEQALKDTDLDGRADLYSLGCTLYFLLTGHPPFPQGTLPERILKHQMQEPPSIRSQRRDVPADLAAICAKMMAKKREDRYQTAAEVSQALAQWRPSATIRRAVSLPRAEPLGDSLDAGFLGIDFKADFRRKPSAKSAAGKEGGAAAAKSNAAAAIAVALANARVRLKAIAAALFATPKRIAAVAAVGALAVIALAALAVVIVVLSRSDRTKTPLKSASTEQDHPAALVAKPGASKPELPKKEEPKKEEPKKEEPKKEEPKKEEPKKEEPKKEEPKKEEPKKEEPKKEEPKKEEPKKEEPKKEEPKKVEPLAELVEAVDLPELTEDGQPPAAPENLVSLGKVHLPPGAALQVALLGGKEIFKGNRSFTLQQDGAGGTPSAWLIGFVSAARGAAPTAPENIARIALDKESLNFQWLPNTADVPAGLLRNCGLLVSVGETNRMIALCRPKMVEPLTLDLDRYSSKGSLSCGALPDAGMLRLQVTGFDGPMSQYEMKPGDTIPPKSKIRIALSDKKLLPIELRVGFEVKTRVVLIEVAMLCQLPGQQLLPFRVKEADKLAKNMVAAKNQLQNLHDKTPGNPPQKQAMAQQLKTMTAAVDQMTALGQWYNGLNKKGKMHFRVFNQIGDRQIDLLTTPPPPAKTDAKPPPAKPPANPK